ncbi:ribbon-helix-helix domain-containing protein [Halocatena halophila]|uniref:ribbon-helix-helix domain-containing protein n=1 Tax=Halocatena halophila TaxID=2814576 RepID=UPI002ED2EA89
MSDASSPGGDPSDTRVQLNVRVTQRFLDRIDEIWQGRGFNSRSEYIRYVLHDAADHQTFDRDELLALAQAERQLREGTTHSFEDVLEQSERDADE